MGTATTFCVLNEKNEYVGGLIAPGLKIAMDSLIRNTAQLPPIVFQTPKKFWATLPLNPYNLDFITDGLDYSKESSKKLSMNMAKTTK